MPLTLKRVQYKTVPAHDKSDYEFTKNISKTFRGSHQATKVKQKSIYTSVHNEIQEIRLQYWYAAWCFKVNQKINTAKIAPSTENRSEIAQWWRWPTQDPSDSDWLK